MTIYCSFNKKNYVNFPFRYFYSVCNVHIILAVCNKIFYVNNNIKSTKSYHLPKIDAFE